MAEFARLRGEGYNVKKIYQYFGKVFSWTVIERALAETGAAITPKDKEIKFLEPQDFKLQETTAWSFETRGAWAVHDSGYRGNWAPEIPRNLILRYTGRDDLVVDQFVGGGTSAIEALLLKRKFVGYDINPAAIKLAQSKINLMRQHCTVRELARIRLAVGDSRQMRTVRSNGAKLVCAHPPYMDIIEYTRTNPADLSTITDPGKFVGAMRIIATEAMRCLMPGGVFCVLIGDIRRNGKVVPLGMRVLNAITDGFTIEEIIIKTQHNCATSHFWSKSNKPSFLRLAHEYLFILKKPVS
jgi:hypothetical protein